MFRTSSEVDLELFLSLLIVLRFVSTARMRRCDSVNYYIVHNYIYIVIVIYSYIYLLLYI